MPPEQWLGKGRGMGRAAGSPHNLTRPGTPGGLFSHGIAIAVFRFSRQRAGPRERPSPGRAQAYERRPIVARVKREGVSVEQLNQMQRYLGEEMIEDYQEGHMSRREMLRRLLGICGSAAAAAALLAACGASSAAAPTPQPAAPPTSPPPPTPLEATAVPQATAAPAAPPTTPPA